ncbi:MAG: hypothetical protein ACI31R_05410 [Bacilli bacterium]
MDKICNICKKSKIYSSYNQCCQSCKMDIIIIINCIISNEKDNIRKFFSEKKNKLNNNKDYYDKKFYYKKIKESNEFLNSIIKQYSNSIKFRDSILKYIDYSNEQMRKIDEVMKKRGKRQLV